MVESMKEFVQSKVDAWKKHQTRLDKERVKGLTVPITCVTTLAGETDIDMLCCASLLRDGNTAEVCEEAD